MVRKKFRIFSGSFYFFSFENVTRQLNSERQTRQQLLPRDNEILENEINSLEILDVRSQ